MKHIYEIAHIKQSDHAFSRVPLESICKIIIGSARSLGIEVGGDEIVNENVLSGCRIPKHEHNAVVPANTLILIVNLTGIGIPAL